MKSELFAIFIITFFPLLGSAFAIENEYDIEYDLLPNIIHEDDLVILEVYNTNSGKISLEKIKNLKIESLDKSIIDVVNLEKNHDFKTLVTLKAISEGQTILYVFAEGSQSLEIPVKVYGNNLPKNISLDLFPDIFDIDENNQGVLSILLTDENGIVTRADKDYLIKLSTSIPGIVSLTDSTVIISKGDFDTKQIFTVNDEGSVTITAKTADIESSELLLINESSELEIEISVIPETISASNTSTGNIIAQLFSGGKLIKATDDITVYFKIEKSDSDSVNTSFDTDTTGYFYINKGQSYGHTSFSIEKGEIDSYTITATTQDPLIIVEETFDTVDVELYGDEDIQFEALSVLADGSRQLVGILYLEDENGHPVTADKNIVVPFTTSDNSISIENSIIREGFESALVYGNMGHFVPSDTDIAPNIPNSEVVSLDIDGFSEDSVSLETNVPSDHFLKGEQHWITVYMESSGELFEIPNDQQIKISDSNIFSVNEQKIEKYPYFTLIPITAIDSGDEDLVISSGKFETTVSLSSISSTPDLLNMEFPETLFDGIQETFVIQILDSAGKPVKTNDNVEIKIFSSDSSILDFPKNVTLSQKSSFVSLDIIPTSSGIVEISLVSEGLPILSEEIIIDEITPTIQITSTDIVEQGGSFLVSILAKQNGLPLQNARVIWELEGGITTISDETTGPTGEASASIISTSDESVKILASIDGPIQSAFASKIIKVNATSLVLPSASDNSFKKPELAGVDPILFIVPAFIAGMVFYLKKKSK